MDIKMAIENVIQNEVEKQTKPIKEQETLTFINTPNGWFNVFFDNDPHGICDETEANARAKALIHLIEQGIVKP